MPNLNYRKGYATVRDPEGIHERPSEAIMAIAGITGHKVFISNSENEIQPKELISLFSLQAIVGTELSVRVEEDPHAEECLDMLLKAIRDPKLTDHFQEYIKEANQLRTPPNNIYS